MAATLQSRILSNIPPYLTKDASYTQVSRLNSHYKACTYKKKKKNIKGIQLSCLPDPKDKRSPLTLNLWSFRPQVKEKHSVSTKLQSPNVAGKKLLT